MWPPPYPSVVDPRSGTTGSNSLTIISYVTHALCLILANTFVTLRFYGKHKIWGSFNGEDFICIIAWLLVLGYSIASIVYTSFGGGHHISELDAAQLRFLLQIIFATLIIYVLAVFFIKILLLTILIRIFTPREKMSVFIRVFTGFILTYYFAILFVRIFVCTPISTYWHAGNGTCINYDVVFILDSSVSLITDGAILVLPMILAWPLHLPLSKKIKVVAILGAGGLAMISNVYRLCLVIYEDKSVDLTGFWVKILYTGAAEIGIGLICACLPATNALLTRQFQRLPRFSGGRNARDASQS